ncbi:MAG: hypothetical protein ACRER7_02300 [Gammaproteobacteria bacterium]
MGFLITSISGFLALFLILFTLVLPYVLRWQMRRGDVWTAAWQRMKLHYWIGYAVLILTILHMYVSMGAGLAHRTSTLGLDLATLGLLLILIQVALGISLRSANATGRLRLRRMHFVIMAGIVMIVLVHLALNSVLIQVI